MIRSILQISKSATLNQQQSELRVCIIRRFSSSGGTPSRERRRRFYVEVGVSPCPAPWDDLDTGKTTNSIVSAGVDGTDSASGVNLSLESRPAQLRKSLSPRKPGEFFHEDRIGGSDLNWFTVTLDGRPIRTPLGRRLAVPSIHLAHGIASEWNSVGMSGSGAPTTASSSSSSVYYSSYLMPSQMPFMTLSCTALDQTSSQVHIYQEQCLRFLHTDTVCYWADPTEDRVLYGRQQHAWKDLHEWIGTDFAPDRPSVAIGHMEGMMLAKGQRGLGHPPQVTKFCEEWVQSLDAWHLTAMHSICSDAKSFWIAAAVIMNNYPATMTNSTTTTGNNDGEKVQDRFTMDVKRALAAARVEEEFNIESWGLVEGGHDYDRLNASIQVTSASLLTDYLALALNSY